jgi:hypothetical protein
MAQPEAPPSCIPRVLALVQRALGGYKMRGATAAADKHYFFSAYAHRGEDHKAEVQAIYDERPKRRSTAGTAGALACTRPHLKPAYRSKPSPCSRATNRSTSRRSMRSRRSAPGARRHAIQW